MKTKKGKEVKTKRQHTLNKLFEGMSPGDVVKVYQETFNDMFNRKKYKDMPKPVFNPWPEIARRAAAKIMGCR